MEWIPWGVFRGYYSWGVFLRVWRSLASGFYLMDYLRDYLGDYLRIVEPLAVLAALTMTEDP